MPGEHDFIHWLRAQPKPPAEVVPIPIGDDLAGLSWKFDDLCLVGVDQVIDGVHFDSSVHPPRAIGAKAMNRNLSDCAAMAVVPAAAVATVALPRAAGLEYAKAIYLGMRAAADVFECPIVGGDTASHDGRLVVTVTILARAAGQRPVTRGGAKAGDIIYVTGPLGGSILGRHMTFDPKVQTARNLVANHAITAMTDISDGLSRDLANVCDASAVGAVLDADRIPIHDDALFAFRADRIEPLQHALHDGEDYELLFTSPEIVPGAIPIGRVIAEPGIRLRMADGSLATVEPRGWEHGL